MEPPKYLRLNRAFLLFTGLWNLEHASNFYKVYRTVMISYFCMYLFRQFVQLYFIIGKDKNEAIKNAGVSMMGVITLTKALVCMSCGCGDMIRIIKNIEDEIFKTKQRKCLEIYMHYIKYNKFILLLFYFCGLIATIASIVSPTMEERFNGFSEKRPLPISIWLPFDNQKHYNIAYFIQSIDGNFGCLFTVSSDTFLLSLMIFAVCQMKILNYKIKTSSSKQLFQILTQHLFIIRYLIPFQILLF